MEKHTSCKLITKLLYRSSCLQMFFKTGVLTNFKIFTGKHLHWSLFFNNVAGSFTKKRLQNRCFPVNIVKFLATTFFIEHLWLLLFYLGTTVLENIVRRNGKKHTHDKFSYNYLGSPTQADHILWRSQYSHVFFIFNLVILTVAIRENPCYL